MGAENVEQVASAVETRVKESGDQGVTPAVKSQIDTALRENNITSQQDMAALSQRLERSGTLPRLLLDKDGVDAFFKKYATPDGQVSRHTLESVSANGGESGYNRLLAQAMLRKYTDIDREAQNYGAMAGMPNGRLSRDEVSNWARRQRDGAAFTPEIPANGLTWVTPGSRLHTKDGKLVELRTFSGGKNAFGADGQDKVAKYGYSKLDGKDTLTSIEVTGGTKYESRDGQNWTRNGQPIQNFRVNPDGTFSFDQKLSDGRQVKTTHNANHSEGSVDSNGKAVQVRYADGSTRDVGYGADGKPNKIVETGRDGKTRTYTPDPNDAKGNWLVDGKPAGSTPTFREPQVGASDFRYTSPDGRTPMIQTTDGLVRRDPNPSRDNPTATPEPRPAAPRSEFRVGADTVKVTGEGDKVTKVERTNPNGEAETITRNADGSYTVQRKGKDGTTTEFAKPGTFKIGADGSYEYQTIGGATVRQNADGSREYKDPSGANTKFSYDPTTGAPTKIERTIPDGKGGTTETLTLTHGQWVLDRNSTMGGNVSDVKINSDGSYSFKFNDRTITQETQRNTREIKQANGDTTRVGFNSDGKPELVIRTRRDRQGNQHREEVKTADGGKTWTVTVDGQAVKAKDVKVHPSGAYEYTSDDGVRVKQLADGTRSETKALPGGGERTVITRPDGAKETQRKRADGSTSTLTVGADGKPIKIVEKNTQTGTESVIEKGADGKWKKTTTAKDGNKKEVAASEPKVNADGSFSYDQEAGKRGRKITANDDGSVSYQVKKGDSLWAISTDILEARLGRKPTNKEIMGMVKGIAGDRQNGIRNQNRIGIGKTYRIPA